MRQLSTAQPRNPPWLEKLKTNLAHARDTLPVSAAFPAQYAKAVDQCIKTAAKQLAKAANLDTPPALIAIGGYGRLELAPCSDIDLLFLHARPPDTQESGFIEQLQSALWALGLSPSCCVHTLDACLAVFENDLHFLTSMLERRLVFGNKRLFTQMDKAFAAFRQNNSASAYIGAKLAERDARHVKMGDTRYQLEPNVKEGKGALRDIQNLVWIAQYAYDAATPAGMQARGILSAAEADTLQQAYDFFWTLRCHLHRQTGRNDNRLSFDQQPAIARLMGYRDKAPHLRAEKMMKDYFRMTTEVGHLTRALCTALEAESLITAGGAGHFYRDERTEIEGFPLVNNRLALGKEGILREKPEEAIRLYDVCLRHGYDIHPQALRTLHRKRAFLAEALPHNATAHRHFLDILLDGRKSERTLRQLNEARLIRALIPDFSNIEAHMQYDMYHVYTADEHTIRAIGMLHKIENGETNDTSSLCANIAGNIHARRALYAALFFHDIAKGTGGDHDAKGAEILRKTAPLLGLSPQETDTAAWLVRHHLFMSETAFRRDLNDPKTITDFTDTVQSPERLRLLAVMTVADIMAVGPRRWNNWKSGLLESLYHKAERVLSGALTDDGADMHITAMQKKLRRQIGGHTGGYHYLIDHAPAAFWESFDENALAAFTAALDGKENDTTVQSTLLPDMGFTQVFVHTRDRRGLFATLAGAMAAAGASIVEARIFTLSSGMALDVFLVQTASGDSYENTGYLKRVVENALTGKINLSDEIGKRQDQTPPRMRHLNIPPRVVIDNRASNTHSLLEINGKDRIGLLYNIASVLAGMDIQISAAKIATYGARVVDVFYIKDAGGMKLLHERRIEDVRIALENTLSDIR